VSVLAQVALCTADLPASVRLYAEALGFRPAGGRVIWGPTVARIQGFEDTAFTLWWLVGDQDFFQLELFAHTLPQQRPRPRADLGWTGFTIAVPDVDATRARLRSAGVEPTARGAGLAFRDPYADVEVDVVAAAASSPGGAARGPAVVSARLAVADLGAARRLYVDALGLAEQPLESGFAVAVGDRRVEVVRPGGDPRPLPADHRLSDQGMMNAAIGYRPREAVGGALDRVLAAGFTANAPLSRSGATYVADGQGTTVELLGVEPERDAAMGFLATQEQR
jgi:catechol 2,3-dioxygenase-like lactoylglutathione lyase family enzyme